jgi:hypothetical protein
VEHGQESEKNRELNQNHEDFNANVLSHYNHRVNLIIKKTFCQPSTQKEKRPIYRRLAQKKNEL